MNELQPIQHKSALHRTFVLVLQIIILQPQYKCNIKLFIWIKLEYFLISHKKEQHYAL